jgi:hypothetical protein
MSQSPGFVPYDPNMHGVLHPPDWTMYPVDDQGETVQIIEHLPTKLRFVPADNEPDNVRFGILCQNPQHDTGELRRRGQEAIRYYCMRIRSTPEKEQYKIDVRRTDVTEQSDIPGVAKITDEMREYVDDDFLLIFADDPADIAQLEASYGKTQQQLVDEFALETCWSEDLSPEQKATTQSRKSNLRKLIILQGDDPNSLIAKRHQELAPKFFDPREAMMDLHVTATISCSAVQVEELERPLPPHMSFDDLQRARSCLAAIVAALAAPFITDVGEEVRPLTQDEMSLIARAMQNVSEKVVQVAARLANMPTPDDYKFPPFIFDLPGHEWTLPAKPPNTPGQLTTYVIELHREDPNDPVPFPGIQGEFPDDATAINWGYYYLGRHRAPSAKIYRGDSEPRLAEDFVCEIRPSI